MPRHRIFPPFVALLLLGVSACVSGCAGFPTATPGAGGNITDTLAAIASDPRCAHTDRVSGNLGGLTGNNLNVFLERTCPAAPVPLSEVTAAQLLGQDPPK